MRCLVTGGAGFIGSHLVDRLIALGAEVTAVDNLATGNLENVHSKARFVQIDIAHCEEWIFRDMEYVFHAAALPRIQPSFEAPVEHEMANVIGTIRCVIACAKAGVRKLVVSSSSACYGNPDEIPTTETARVQCLSPYALQKYSAEQHALLLGRRYGIPVVSLRYFNVYGPRSFNPKNPFNAYSSVIGIFSHQKKQGQPLTITGDGGQSRDFVHVADVVEANIKAALSEYSFECFNVGSGKNYTINYVAGLFSDRVVYIPEREGEARQTLADIGKIKRDFGWSPRISLIEGINWT